MRRSVVSFRILVSCSAVLLFACSSDTVTDPNTPIGLQLSLSPATDTIFITDTLTGAETVQLSVAAVSQSRSIAVPTGRVFESQSPAIAAVDSVSGLVHALSVGTADVVVRVNGVRAHSTIVVEHPTSRIIVTPGIADILEDNTFGTADTTRVHAQAYGADGKALVGVRYSFSSSDTTVVVVDPSGKVRALKIGTATITSTANNLTGTATVHAARATRTLAVNAVADSIFVDKPIATTDTTLLQPIAKDSLGGVRTGLSYTFVTSDPSVATVSASGVVTAKGLGTATVTATGADLNVSKTVSVLSLAKTVTLTATASGWLVGDTIPLSASALGWRGTTLSGRTFSYATPAGNASVAPTGHAVFGTAGTATFTATTAFTTSNGLILTAFPREFIASTVGTLSTGGDATCGLLPLNRAYCFGTGTLLGVTKDTSCFDDLGGSPRPCSLVPLRVGGNLQFTAVSVGDSVACGIILTSHVYCWGDQTYGELGNGISQAGPPALPALVITTQGTAVTLVQISAGHAHACGVDPSGAAYCWGKDATFQLGGGGGKHAVNSSTPIPVWLGSTVHFTSISAGGNHTCALSDAGTAYCWGLNTDGQLGRGTVGDSSDVPAPVSGSQTFIQVSAGFRHTCGLTQSQQIYCWGANDSLQAGQSAGQRILTPTLVAGSGYSALAVGAAHNCALISGTAYCWGKNDYGQLGRGFGTTNSPSASAVPTAVAQGSLVFSNISAGRRTSCAIAADGLYCWGSAVMGALGDNLQALSVPFPRKTAVPQ
ncbi:MAG TPA: Ig-like domain-containing protein [Gemmatimonadaceae bacterium]|nr:Ig-like domain-containing protein [Gemmatimonadaceae bacterium]